MVVTEGIGQVAPSPITLVFDGGEISTVLIEAKKRAAYRRYRTLSDTWSRGLKCDVVIPGVGLLKRDVRPIFAGTLGEYATCIFLNRRFDNAVAKSDTAMRRWGDFGIDLEVFRRTLQIKTRQSDSPFTLIRRKNSRGRLIHLRASVVVCCEWKGDRSVKLLGWIWSSDLQDKTSEPAIVGNHQNIRIHDVELLPMARLVDDLEAIRG